VFLGLLACCPVLGQKFRVVKLADVFVYAVHVSALGGCG
jgi:hypothetical protein